MKALSTCLLAFALLTVFAACGDDEGGGADDVDASANAPDADPNAPDADPNAPDADPNAPDGGQQGVDCGGQTCNSSQECCVMGGGPGGQMCVDTGTCQGTVIDCDGAEDCTTVGEVCCGGVGQATCQEEATCNVVVCNSEDDCPAQDEVCCQFGPSSICSAFCPGG
jgi:hypothetical protein